MSVLNNFVGGYAGSGTRVIQMMLEKAGILVRAKGFDNLSYDEHYTMKFWFNIAHKYIATGTEIDEQFTEDFLKEFEEFRSGSDNWSLKCGETMWCMPFLYKLFPNSTYILMVRNGLDNILNDHIFSEGYSKVFVYTDAIYKIENFSFWGHRMIFWNQIHERAVREGEEYFDKKFLIVRLEDVIEFPIREGKRIFDHLGLEFKDEYVDFVEPQLSVNKHKKRWVESRFGGHVYRPETHLEDIKAVGNQMLTRFGYVQ